MKVVTCSGFVLASLFCFAQERPSVSLVHEGDAYLLRWPITQGAGSAHTLRYQMERSEDLTSWDAFGVPVRTAATGQTVSRTLDPATDYGFYRVGVTVEESATALAEGGADIFGYSDLFQQELGRIGQITPNSSANAMTRARATCRNLAGIPLMRISGLHSTPTRLITIGI